MTVLLVAIFAVLAFGAIGFAVWPILHGRGARGGLLLGCAIAVLVLGLGLGTYVMLGSPALALRTLTGPSDNDIRGLVAVLAQRVRQTPDNPRGWSLLGRGYLSLNDPSDAAAAFRRALMVTPPAQRGRLFSSYGEALTLPAGGAVQSLSAGRARLAAPDARLFGSWRQNKSAGRSGRRAHRAQIRCGFSEGA